MAATQPSLSDLADKTFTTFTNDQGADYAQYRPKYHPNLYKTILDHHTSTGGQLDTVLDIGCGPGIAVRALASNFVHAIGLDPSKGMMNSARLLGGSSSTEPIRFEVSSAEELGFHLLPPVEDSSVDLITAATAAHWFDMERFWPRTARILKPGGTVAIWSTGRIQVHADIPNGAAIQAAMDEIEDRELVPFFEKGNHLVHTLYTELQLPWMVNPPVVDFNRATLFRKEWGFESNEDFFANGDMTFDLDTMEKILGTSSPVERWRKAHRDDVGTERDVIRLIRRATERLLHEAGVKGGEEIMKGSLMGVLLIVKKNF